MSRILKNVSFTTIGQFSNTLLAFVLLPFAAHYLDNDEFGKYSLGSTLMFFVNLVCDLGLETLLTREIARKKRLSARLLSIALGAKTFLILLAVAFVMVFLLLTPYDYESRIVIIIFSVVGIVGSFSLTLSSVYRSHELMQYETLGNVLEKIVIVGLAVLLLVKGYGVIVFSTVFLIAVFIKLAYNIYVLNARFFPVHVDFDYFKSRMLLKSSFFLGLSVFLSMVYNKIDIVMLSMMQSMDDVSWYSASYRLLTFTSIIPTILVISFLPQLSSSARDKQALSRLFFKGIKYLLVIVIPMIPYIYFLAEDIITIIFGIKYANSVIALKYLVFATFAQMFNIFFVSIYVATNRQNRIVFIQVIALVTNVILNLMLIPRLSYVGASIATIVTEGIILLYITSYALKNIIVFPRRAHLYIGKISLATLIGLAIFGMLSPLKIDQIALAVGTIILYFLILLKFRWIEKPEF